MTRHLRPLGAVRRPLHPAAASYPMRAALPASRPRVSRRVWPAGPVLDQGALGACVGFGFTAELMAAPAPDRDVPRPVAEAFARRVYYRARQIAGLDQSPTDGTTPESGALAVRELGLIGGFYWATSIDEVRDALLASGPVVATLPWVPSMDRVSRRGTVRVRRRPTASYHCLLVLGYDPAHEFGSKRRPDRRPGFLLRNSWGHSWGGHVVRRRRPGKRGPVWRRGREDRGQAWISAEDLAWGLEEFGWSNGAAVLVTGRAPVDLAAVA